MSRLLPFKSETTRKPDSARVLSLEEDATEDALAALSSDTAREILSLVYDEPRTPPEIRDEIESSLQNVHYHLENLEEADLIQPAGSGYSEKGTEMTVYAPASEAVVLFAGPERDRSRLKTALTRLLGAVGLLVAASFVVRRLAQTSDVVTRGLSGAGGADGADAAADGGGGGDAGGAAGGGAADGAGTPTPETRDGGDGGVGVFERETATDTPTEEAMETATPEPAGTPTPEATDAPVGSATETVAETQSPTAVATSTPTSTPAPTQEPTATETPTATATPEPTATPVNEPVSPETVQAASDASGGLLSDPAVTFFLGGVFMLAVVGAWWYLAR